MRRAARAAAVAAGAAALCACTGRSGPAPAAAPAPITPVTVPAPTATGPLVVSSCSRLVRALPATIGGGLARRPVAGDPQRTAAWGEPPVTLSCGVPAPERLSEPVQLGPPATGTPRLVTFSTRDIGPATRWTTRDRSVDVAIDVPDRYDGQVLVPLTTPILDVLPAR